MTTSPLLLEMAYRAEISWGNALWCVSVDGAFTFLALWLLVKLVRWIPSRLECWLWRVAFVKMWLGLFWVGAIPLSVLPVPPLFTGRNALILSGPLPRYPQASPWTDPVAIVFLLWSIGTGFGAARIVRRRQGRRDLAEQRQSNCQCRSRGIP